MGAMQHPPLEDILSKGGEAHIQHPPLEDILSKGERLTYIIWLNAVNLLVAYLSLI